MPHAHTALLYELLHTPRHGTVVPQLSMLSYSLQLTKLLLRKYALRHGCDRIAALLCAA